MIEDITINQHMYIERKDLINKEGKYIEIHDVLNLTSYKLDLYWVCLQVNLCLIIVPMITYFLVLAKALCSYKFYSDILPKILESINISKLLFLES